MKKLKEQKKVRDDTKVESFDSVYSYEGRIYVKKVRNTDRSSAIPISSMKSAEKFLYEISQAV